MSPEEMLTEGQKEILFLCTLCYMVIYFLLSPTSPILPIKLQNWRIFGLGISDIYLIVGIGVLLTLNAREKYQQSWNWGFSIFYFAVAVVIVKFLCLMIPIGKIKKRKN